MQFIRPNKLQADDLILDIRSDEEYIKEHLLQPHIHEDFEGIHDINVIIKKYGFDNSKTIHILCSSGASRAEIVAHMFEDNGFHNVAVILGGMDGIKYDEIKTSIN